MKLYTTIQEALSEIQRDVYKGPRLVSSRVQQIKGKELPGRELLSYSYAIERGGIPFAVDDIVELGQKFKFKAFLEHPREMRNWLLQERIVRFQGLTGQMTEKLHPALVSTVEGNWPSYTYGERLHGALDALEAALQASPDSRRAYWPIYQPVDSLRSPAPTRVPCSLGYQFLIRNTLKGEELICVYLQRSADFDTFLLTDIYLANQFQQQLAERLQVKSGQFQHFITSLHSFEVEGTEIY